MADVDFGETLNPQEMISALQARLSRDQGSHDGKKKSLGSLSFLNEKNTELLKKLDEARQELCLLLLETSAKYEQVYAEDYGKLLCSELERMQALENKSS